MMLKPNFLLRSDFSLDLFRATGALPIVDYHSHLPIRLLAENKPFKNITDLWIRGDHYKWRAMRLNGIPERFCSGNSSDKEKFLAWASTVPFTLRNPLHHWTSLELSKYFKIDDEFGPDTAEQVWDKTNGMLETEEFLPRQLLLQSKVQILCTTDDPADSLDYHNLLSSENYPVEVVPTFRPDSAMDIGSHESFDAWIKKLSKESRIKITTLDNLLHALESRHEDFHDAGCRASDHGLEYCYSEPCDIAEANVIFLNWKSGKPVDTLSLNRWRSFILTSIARMNFKRGWVMMLHLGAIRNNNTSISKTLGADTGCDSVGDFPQAAHLNRFMSNLENDGNLPKIVIFNSNPADNLVFATTIGNFFDGKTINKIQFGPGWWFLDSIRGMTEQINSLSEVGLLHHFIGMTTDSRSFLSFSRHEYFRRLMCNLLAEEAEQGMVPADFSRLAHMLNGIFFENPKKYFNWPTQLGRKI